MKVKGIDVDGTPFTGSIYRVVSHRGAAGVTGLGVTVRTDDFRSTYALMSDLEYVDVVTPAQVYAEIQRIQDMQPAPATTRQRRGDFTFYASLIGQYGHLAPSEAADFTFFNKRWLAAQQEANRSRAEANGVYGNEVERTDEQVLRYEVLMDRAEALYRQADKLADQMLDLGEAMLAVAEQAQQADAAHAGA